MLAPAVWHPDALPGLTAVLAQEGTGRTPSFTAAAMQAAETVHARRQVVLQQTDERLRQLGLLPPPQMAGLPMRPAAGQPFLLQQQQQPVLLLRQPQPGGQPSWQGRQGAGQAGSYVVLGAAEREGSSGMGSQPYLAQPLEAGPTSQQALGELEPSGLQQQDRADQQQQDRADQQQPASASCPHSPAPEVVVGQACRRPGTSRLAVQGAELPDWGAAAEEDDVPRLDSAPSSPSGSPPSRPRGLQGPPLGVGEEPSQLMPGSFEPPDGAGIGPSSGGVSSGSSSRASTARSRQLAGLRQQMEELDRLRGSVTRRLGVFRRPASGMQAPGSDAEPRGEAAVDALPAGGAPADRGTVAPVELLPADGAEASSTQVMNGRGVGPSSGAQEDVQVPGPNGPAGAGGEGGGGGSTVEQAQAFLQQAQALIARLNGTLVQERHRQQHGGTAGAPAAWLPGSTALPAVPGAAPLPQEPQQQQGAGRWEQWGQLPVVAPGIADPSVWAAVGGGRLGHGEGSPAGAGPGPGRHSGGGGAPAAPQSSGSHHHPPGQQQSSQPQRQLVHHPHPQQKPPAMAPSAQASKASDAGNYWTRPGVPTPASISPGAPVSYAARWQQAASGAGRGQRQPSQQAGVPGPQALHRQPGQGSYLLARQKAQERAAREAAEAERQRQAVLARTQAAAGRRQQDQQQEERARADVAAELRQQSVRRVGGGHFYVPPPLLPSAPGVTVPRLPPLAPKAPKVPAVPGAVEAATPGPAAAAAAEPLEHSTSAAAAAVVSSSSSGGQPEFSGRPAGTTSDLEEVAALPALLPPLHRSVQPPAQLRGLCSRVLRSSNANNLLGHARRLLKPPAERPSSADAGGRGEQEGGGGGAGMAWGACVPLPPSVAVLPGAHRASEHGQGGVRAPGRLVCTGQQEAGGGEVEEEQALRRSLARLDCQLAARGERAGKLACLLATERSWGDLGWAPCGPTWGDGGLSLGLPPCRRGQDTTRWQPFGLAGADLPSQLSAPAAPPALAGPAGWPPAGGCQPRVAAAAASAPAGAGAAAAAAGAAALPRAAAPAE